MITESYLFDLDKHYSKDLYESSFLYAKGLQFSRLIKVGHEYFFEFPDKKEAEKYRDAYWSKSPNSKLLPKEYADAVKSLKTRLFANP